MLVIVPDLDQQYSPSTVAHDPWGSLERYRVRRELDVREVAYGPHEAEVLDLFPGPQNAPLVAWVHGGHWQEGSKEDGAWAAEALVNAGYSFASIGYGLAPARSLPEMTASVRRALHWLAEHHGPVYAAGSSAGGHLVAMALTGADPAPLAGAALLSGTYDLKLIPRTYVNDVLHLDDATARELSPIDHLPLAVPRLVVARGERETAEYQRMHDELASASGVEGLVVPDRDHFDVVFDLIDPATALGSAVHHHLREISREC